MERKTKWMLGALLGAGMAGGAFAMRQRQKAEDELLTRLKEEGKKLRVVLLGAGFGGLSMAIDLCRGRVCREALEITVVDQQNYQLFTPLLYHVASGLVDPTHIAFPVRTVARKHGFHFIERKVEGIDLAQKRVLMEGMELEADLLVLALGSVTNYFGLEERVADHAFTLKSLSDAVAIRNRVLEAFERAEVEPDPEERRRWLTFVVVGAGATGVELIGALRGYIDLILLRDYPGVRREEVRTILAEARDEILPGMRRELAALAIDHLKAKGIEIHLNTKIARITPDAVETADGTIVPCRMAVWAAGVKASPLATALPAQKARDGRLIVNEQLRLPEYDGVYALGDIAASYADPESERPLPQDAQVAVQEGDWLGENLPRLAGGLPAKPFEYRFRGHLVSLGRNDALADLNGVCLTGFPAWVLWRSFYLGKLAGFRNKLGVAIDWSFSYFYGRETARIECGHSREEVVQSTGGAARPAS